MFTKKKKEKTQTERMCDGGGGRYIGRVSLASLFWDSCSACTAPTTTGVTHFDSGRSQAPHGQNRIPKKIPPPHTEPWSPPNLDQFLYRLASPALSEREDPPEPMDLLAEGALLGASFTPPMEPTSAITVEVLDMKLHTLLQNLTHNIPEKMGKIAQELRGKIYHLGDRTDFL